MRSRGSQRSQIRLVKKEEQKASNFSKKPSNNAPPKDLSPDKTKQATVKISDLSKDELIEVRFRCSGHKFMSFKGIKYVYLLGFVKNIIQCNQKIFINLSKLTYCLS